MRHGLWQFMKLSAISHPILLPQIHVASKFWICRESPAIFFKGGTHACTWYGERNKEKAPLSIRGGGRRAGHRKS
jgi:hypothetical protein